MPIKIHTCGNTWIHGPHPCWQVMKALDEQGIAYEQVKNPTRRSRRTQLEELSGQRLLPVLEFENGTVLREESKEMVKRIREGGLSSAAALG